MDIDITPYKNEFLELLRSCNRDGLEDVISDLEECAIFEERYRNGMCKFYFYQGKSDWFLDGDTERYRDGSPPWIHDRYFTPFR